MNSSNKFKHSRCIGCLHKNGISTDISQQIIKLSTLNKKITKSVGQSSNQYLGNLVSLNVSRDIGCSKIGKNNQSSDRYYKASIPRTAIIPTRGNSTKRTQTTLRPGALGPGGIGVDIKHNSYARYLAKKKGKAILGETTPTTIKNSKRVINNKFMKSRVVSGGIVC